MRKPNIELNASKLATKKVQLAQYDTRIADLKARLADVVSQREKKATEISQLETVISTTQNSTPVSN